VPEVSAQSRSRIAAGHLDLHGKGRKSMPRTATSFTDTSGRRNVPTKAGKATALLVVVTLLTRWPAWHNRFGESDSARYAVGILQWLRDPRHAGAPEIYGRVFSPAYDWGAVHVLSAFPRLVSELPLLLNAASLVAALLSAPLLLAIGRRFVSGEAAFWATLFFVVTPAYWWLGIEPLPQGWSSLGYLLAIWLALRAQEATDTRQAWFCRGGSAIALACGLACKSDLVLGLAVFPLLELRRPAAASRPKWAHLATGSVVPAMASILFLLLRSLLLGEGWRESQQAAGHAVGTFLAWPHGPTLVKQLLPMWLGAGVLTPIFLLGMGRAWRALSIERHGLWCWLLAAWSAPSVVFWFLIRGNNARHTALVILPWLWLAAAGWFLRQRRQAPFLVLILLAGNFLIVPPSSNIALYPSGDVPASSAVLAARQREMKSAATLLCHPPPASCYLGWYTNPYLEYDLMQECGTDGVLDDRGNWTLFHSTVKQSGRVQPRVVAFREVHDVQEYLAAARVCSAASSLEYEKAGKRWYFGREISAASASRR